MNNKFYFLLGGHDLEMSAIKLLLKQLNITTINDKGLNWGNASWKSYKDTIDQLRKEDDYIVVGIELKDKDQKPANAIDIDHHNAERCKPSSLEQVAELLKSANILKDDLSIYQKQIAANDKGYIQAMLDMNMSPDDIENIRQQERRILKINNDDWLKAEKSVKEHSKYVLDGKLLIIEALTPKFAAISDYLWLEYCKIHTDNKRKDCPEAVIIYNDNNLVYSGILFPEFINQYQELTKQGYAYYGGQGKQSYWGFTKDAFKTIPQDQIITQINNILNKYYIETNFMNQENINQMHSYHVFLFPFRWQHIAENLDDITTKFSLENFENKLCPKPKEKNEWKRRRYELTNGTTYNEYNYFYDFVREVLYDIDENLETKSNTINNQLIRHYEYQPADVNQSTEKMFYNIQVENKIYRLEVDSILLNMYGTGVGVLSFHLRNRSHPNSIDILKINKFGRRLYPPFFGLPKDNVKTGSQNDKPSEYLYEPKNNEIPEAIWISKGEQLIGEMEDWHNYNCPSNFKYGPFRLPAFIKTLFPKNFFSTHEKENNGKLIYLRPALDDRMFVVSWYGNKTLIRQLKKINYSVQPYQYNYANDDFWHNYIFIDTWRTYQNKLKLPKLMEKHTYDRWVDYGTLFGMSRYSMVMLTGENAPAFLIRHLQTMYYKMAEIVLLQRASIISFSDEVTHVSDLVHQDDDKAVAQIEDLYKNYLLFDNKIYFREITTQEQGVEMYDMMQKTMRIREQVEDLKDEISELNQMARLIADKKEHKEMKMHTLLATIFLPAMLISGILGMNILTGGKTTGNNEKFHSLTDFIRGNYMLLEFVVISLTSTLALWIFTKLDNKTKIGYCTFLFWLSIIIFLFLTKIYLS